MRGNTWILGMTVRSKSFKDTILIPLQSRDSNTLIPLIQKYVSKDSKMVVTDKWRAYSSL